MHDAVAMSEWQYRQVTALARLGDPRDQGLDTTPLDYVQPVEIGEGAYRAAM